MAERKDLIQEFVQVSASGLLETVSDIKTAGYRLGQICATTMDENIEVLYSFEKDNALKNLKVEVPLRNAELHSLTAIYWPAFIYENEMHDLFGITFKNLALDFGGHFFKIAKKTPWNPQAQEVAKEETVGESAASAVAGVQDGTREESPETENSSTSESAEVPGKTSPKKKTKAESPAAPKSEGGEE
jgi:ech hydrogenase subunit D